MQTMVPGREHHCYPHDAHLSFTEWTPGTVSRWIGKCPACKTARRVEVRQDVRLTWQYSTPDKMAFSTRVYQYEVLSPGTRHYAQARGGLVVVARCEQGCTDRHGEVVWMTCKRIEGVHNAGIACNAKCVNATGPNCECSCAGDNHGGAHA